MRHTREIAYENASVTAGMGGTSTWKQPIFCRDFLRAKLSSHA